MFLHLGLSQVMGSMKWPLSRLEIYGSLEANGQGYRHSTVYHNDSIMGGPGGGSGGTVLLFIQALFLEKNSSLSVTGGDGGLVGGGGGGGGRIHFDWSNIGIGDEYVQIASVNGAIMPRYASYYQQEKQNKTCILLYGSFQKSAT